jgi:hypothetical protein
MKFENTQMHQPLDLVGERTGGGALPVRECISIVDDETSGALFQP